MEPIASVMEDRTVTFHFPEPSRLSPPILTLEDAAVGYEAGQPILSHLDLRLDMDDRVALLGANGNGKSTLSRLFAGRLAPMTGRMTRSSKLKIGYFAQDQRSEEHTSELQSLMRISYAVFCLQKQNSNYI